jgi:hypothetical protein
MAMEKGEEKPRGFKVEDRRRFSSEGEPKPEARETEEKRPQPENVPHQAAAPSTAGQHVGPESPFLPAAITFSTFVVGLSTQALVHLGEIPDPVSGQQAPDLPGAQQLIDILGMLQEKTKGNLGTDEQNLLQAILFDLRMKYVQIARPAN